MLRAARGILWIAIGVALSHLLHYLYFTSITDQSEAAFSGQFARLLLQSLPVIKTVFRAVIFAIPWLLLLAFAGAGLILFLRHKQDLTISAKLRNAEEIMEEAEKERNHYQTLVSHCEEEYNRKEQSLKSQFAKREKALTDDFVRKQAPYTEEIKRLKEEKVELREAVTKLMSMLKKK